MMKSRTLYFLVSLIALLSIACGDKKTAQQPPLPHVTFMHPIQNEVTDTIQLDGVVAPSETVDLVARVSGYLTAAPFTEGREVKAGQTLFIIEREPYQQQVKLNQAKLEQTRAEYQRQQILLKENATAKSSVESALSNLQQAEANLRLAQINLGYTTVKAPFDGVIGKRTVDIGNYVGAAPGGSVLATIRRLRPAYVNFTLNERDLLRLLTSRTTQNNVNKIGKTYAPVAVQAMLQGESQPSENGMLNFIDNNLSSTTGSLQLRARFDNERLHLLPGLYCKVFINIGKPRPALLIPANIVLNDQVGQYVYLIDANSQVIRRNIKAGAAFGQLKEIIEGLTPNDQVIIEGLSNVGVGQKVVAQIDNKKITQ